MAGRAAVIAAWLAHLYTGSGAVLAFLATLAVFESDYRAAFSWLALQIFVDATDGWFARRAQVSVRLPWFNGSKLDDIVDYLAYVFVPALIVWHATLVPRSWALVVVAAMLLSSAYGFNRADAKSEDHFFTGFPSYWNIVVLYLFVAGLPAGANAAILAGLAVLVFVPIRYVYPSRTHTLQTLTVTLGAVWALLMLALLWLMPDVPAVLVWVSLVFPAYYIALSLALHLSRRRGSGTAGHN